MALRVAELELLFTANTDQVDKAEKQVKATGQALEKKPITTKLDADAKGALAGMDRVEGAAKKLVSQDTSLKLDADIGRAEKSLERAKQRLADLEVRALGGLDVTADVRRAEANLSKIERNLDGLRTARNMIEVDADTTQAEGKLDDVSDAAGDAGKDSGEEFGKNIVAALVAIPIAGAVVGIGVAAGKALLDGFQDGLQQQVGYDRLQALTGISAGDALRLGRAAGEAYANVFGESVEANMDTARLALQFKIIDADTSTRSAQQVIQSLAGIADVLGEDVRPIATAVTTLLKSGMAKNAEEAFDLIATGARNGVNRGEDLLDTFTEYPAVLRRLGLTGSEMLGLLNQSLAAGARNSDVAADALKEFQIRATDASEASADGFEALGLNAEEMTAKIARGGEDARDGLDAVLTKLRETEDPVVRNTAAVALFGTKAEDLGEALFAMDLSSAVDQLDGVTGSAQRMFDTLADNDATKMEQAKRNIEVAADGIKGALAAAFSEPLGELADFVSRNRGPVLQFMLDLANGALDFGVSMVEASASAGESLGDFVSGPASEAIDAAARLLSIFNADAGKELHTLAEDMRGFEATIDEAADTMRRKLIEEGIEPARERMNEFGKGAVAFGFLNDASLRLAESIGEVGLRADGTALSLEWVDLANLRTTESGRQLEESLRNAIAALGDEISAADAAGESQDALAERYNAGRDALLGQMTQMGLTREEAQLLIDTVLRTPSSATTEFGSNAVEEQDKVQRLADRIFTLPDGSVVIAADTETAQTEVDEVVRRNTGREIRLTTRVSVGGGTFAHGAVLDFMAAGGIRGLTPMSPVAQVVPANTWRVVGDRMDVPESYIPLDGSPRSMAILAETMRRMGVTPMADGAVARAGHSGSSRVTSAGLGGGPVDLSLSTIEQLARALARYSRIDARMGVA